MKVLRALAESKKAIIGIVGLVAVIGSAAGLKVSEEALTNVITAIATIVSVLLATFGAQDIGKEGAAIKADALKAVSQAGPLPSSESPKG